MSERSREMQRTISFAKVKQTNTQTKNRTRPDKRIISWLNLNSGESLLSTNEKKTIITIRMCASVWEWMNEQKANKRHKKKTCIKYFFVIEKVTTQMLQLSDKIKYKSNKKSKNTHTHGRNISFEEIPQHISFYRKIWPWHFMRSGWTICRLFKICSKFLISAKKNLFAGEIFKIISDKKFYKQTQVKKGWLESDLHISLNLRISYAKYLFSNN